MLTNKQTDRQTDKHTEKICKPRSNFSAKENIDKYNIYRATITSDCK